MKYPDGFAGWLPLGLILDGRYMVLEKPDHKYQALIHVVDNDVVEVLEARSGEAVYTHPLNLKAARQLFTMIKMETWMFANYKKT